MKPLIFHSQAQAELADAMKWYEDRTAGLGFDLLGEVEKSARDLQQNPGQFRLHGRSGMRKILINRFPYTLFFLELPDVIWIAAIAHQKRRPGYWRTRKPELE